MFLRYLKTFFLVGLLISNSIVTVWDSNLARR